MAEWIIIQRNIERLISRCESIIDGKLSPYGKEWKLGKVYVMLTLCTFVFGSVFFFRCGTRLVAATYSL